MRRTDDDQILEAAAHAFADVGFHATSMTAVARGAGTTKPTLYAHFGDKDRLFEATLGRERDLLLTHLFSAYERVVGAGMAEQIARDVDAIFDYAEQRPHGFALLFGDWSSAPVLRVRRELADRVEERIATLVLAYVEHSADLGVALRPEHTHLSREAADLLAGLMVATSLEGARRALGRPAAEAEAIRRATASYLLSALQHVDVTGLQ